MHPDFREKLKQKILHKAQIQLEGDLQFKHCKNLAEYIDCDPNSLARLLGVGKFKQSEHLKPKLESKIAVYLGHGSYNDLEKSLYRELIIEEFMEFSKKGK